MTESCQSYRLLLARVADDTLGSADAARVSAHVASCDDCRRELEIQRFARAVLRERPVTSASPGFRATVIAVLSPESWLDRFDFRRLTWRLAPIAAVAGVLTYAVLGRVSWGRSTTGTAGVSDAPVSAALMSDRTDLLSLMLFANPDDALSTTTATGGGR